MKLSLRYEGPLNSSSEYRLTTKQQLRAAFHHQLFGFCSAQPQHPRRGLWPLTVAPLPTVPLKGNAIDFPDGVNYGVVKINAYEFVPIVTRRSNDNVHIRIALHRREQPGAIIQGGDLDNRLKTLFDGLRIPHYAQEVPDDDPGDSARRLFCLLEDDSLITSVDIETHQLFTSPGKDERITDVKLEVYVTLTDIV